MSSAAPELLLERLLLGGHADDKWAVTTDGSGATLETVELQRSGRRLTRLQDILASPETSKSRYLLEGLRFVLCSSGVISDDDEESEDEERRASGTSVSMAPAASAASVAAMLHCHTKWDLPTDLKTALPERITQRLQSSEDEGSEEEAEHTDAEQCRFSRGRLSSWARVGSSPTVIGEMTAPEVVRVLARAAEEAMLQLGHAAILGAMREATADDSRIVHDSTMRTLSAAVQVAAIKTKLRRARSHSKTRPAIQRIEVPRKTRWSDACSVVGGIQHSLQHLMADWLYDALAQFVRIARTKFNCVQA
jgi:hypothetical protein